MKVLSIYSIKGGVGKTSSSVNLAYHFAKRGKSTLLIDLDPQGASSFYLKVTAKKGFHPKKLTSAKANLEPFVRESDYPGLDILPSDMQHRNLDLILSEKEEGVKSLRNALKEFKKAYDYVVLDCPPNITLLSENVFRASDLILCPVIPSPLSERTFNSLEQFFEKQDISLKKVYGFFSMVEGRKRVHKDTMEAMKNQLSRFFDTVVPRSADVEKMGVNRKPVQEFARTRVSSLAIGSLGDEIMAVLEGKKKG